MSNAYNRGLYPLLCERGTTIVNKILVFVCSYSVVISLSRTLFCISEPKFKVRVLHPPVQRPGSYLDRPSALPLEFHPVLEPVCSTVFSDVQLTFLG